MALHQGLLRRIQRLNVLLKRLTLQRNIRRACVRVPGNKILRLVVSEQIIRYFNIVD